MFIALDRLRDGAGSPILWAKRYSLGNGAWHGIPKQNRHGQPYPNSDPYSATKRESEPNPTWSRLAKG